MLENTIRLFREGIGNINYMSPAGGGGGGGSVNSVGGNNGLVVTGTATDPVVQLGQTVGEPGDPGKLLRNSQIPMNGFGLQFIGAADNILIDLDGSLEFGGPTTDDAIQTLIYLPNNYNTAYAGHGRAGGFFQGWARFNGVNIYPRPNVVGQMWAYNIVPGGGQQFSDEAGFSFRTETDFGINSGPIDYFEFHLPEVTAVSGLVVRLWSFYTAKDTLSTIHQSQVQSFNFNTKNENETYFAWTCSTAGGPPDTDRTLDFEYTAKGSFASIILNFADQDNTFSKGFWQWDRGSLNLGLQSSGSSLNNRTISITGNIRQGGAASGNSFIQTFSLSDQPTEFSAQLFSDTFNNNPSYVFDRRTGLGSSLIGDGNNGGEVTWTGDRNLNISGIANGVAGGVTPCFDLVVSGLDTDNLQHENMRLKRSGEVSFPRGSITSADPGAGSGAWKLGQLHAAAVTADLTHYVEVNIEGTVIKLLVAN